MNVSTTLQPDQSHAMDACWQPPPDGTTFKFSKGAPRIMVAHADDSDMITGAVGTAVNDFAARGYRSLGVACGGSDGEWKCLGVLPLFDPTRDDANAAGLGDVKKKTAKALAETSIAA